jgi:hypothetical protein
MNKSYTEFFAFGKFFLLRQSAILRFDAKGKICRRREKEVKSETL